MAVHSVKIDEGSSQLVIDENATYRFGFQHIAAENGQARGKLFKLIIHGKLKKADASTLYTSLMALAAEVTTKNSPRRVQVLLDSTAKYDFKPEECVSSPIVTRFDTFDSPGTGHEHWEYELEIEIKKGGTGGESSDVTDLDTWIETEENEAGEIVRKVWHASATAKNVTNAEAAVMAFKPSGKNLRHRLRLNFQRASAEAEWVYEARRADKILSILEVVRVTGQGKGYLVSKQVGSDPSSAPPPKFHVRRRGAPRLEVQVTILAFTKDIARLPLHFAESGTYFHQEDEEAPPIEAVPHDEKRGLWRLEYTEVWLARTHFHKPKHQGHDDLQFINPPGDGKMTQNI